MAKKQLGVVVCLFLLSLAVPLHAAVFHPHSKTLANGLQIIVIENHMSPMVSHMLWVKAGSADEPLGQSGVAHYLEHLMFKATKKRPAGSYSKAIASKGGTENAFTSYDYTGYFANVAKDNLALVMDLESDRMANLVFDSKEAVPELAVVLDEKRQRVDSDPSSHFMQQVRAVLYPHHPYGTPIIGWQQEIENLTTADAHAFYTKWYRPENTVLVISGDVNAHDTFKMAERYYGTWKKGENDKPRARVTDPAFIGEVKIDVADERVKEKTMVVARKMPSRRQNPKRASALEVLQEMIAGSDASYLIHELVTKRKLATELDVSFNADQYDDTLFTISLIPKADDNTLIEAIDESIKAYAKAPIDEKELALAKQSLTRAAIFARDSVMGPAYAFGLSLTAGQSIDDVENWPESIQAVTAHDIQQALQALIAAPKTMGVLRPLDVKINKGPPS